MSIHDIADNLEKHLALLNALIELAERKKEALIAGDVDTITQIVQKENKSIRVAAQLEQERLDSIRAIFLAQELKPPRHVTISDLIRIAVNIEGKKRLTEAHAGMLQAVRKLKSLNDLNRQLIDQSLAFIEYSLDLYMGPEDDTVYHNPMKQQSGGARKGFYNFKA